MIDPDIPSSNKRATMSTVAKRFGWRKDALDPRDHTFAVRAPTKIPDTFDLRTKMPPVYDQGDLGSCTANAIAAAYEYELAKQQLPDFTPSRLAIYYGEREIEHTINSDAGAEIRDGMKVVAKQGVAPEVLWPYAPPRFMAKPPASYYAAAFKHLCVAYERVQQTERGIKGAIASGYPVVFGISVFESFESATVARTGVVPMPNAGREKMLGGHAICAVGYTKTHIVCRNSWGDQWGQHGYFTLPTAYVLSESLASDFWTVRTVE